MSGRLLALLVAALAFLELALLYLAVPLVPRWRAEFGLSGSSEGIALGAYSGAIALLSLPVGALVDRVGARGVTLVSTVAAVAATPLIAFAHEAWQLVAVRFLQGAFAAGVWTAGIAWITAVLEPHEQAGAIGRVEGAAVVGSFVGPLLGGPVATAIGLRGVAFALATLALGLFVVLLWAPAGKRPAQADSGSAPQGEVRLLRAGLFVIVATSAATATVALVAPLMLARDGFDGTSIGCLFAGGAAVAAFASAAITSRLPASPRTAGALVAILGTVTTAGAFGGGSPLFAAIDIVAAVSLQAVGFGYAFALVAAGAPAGRRGRALAVANTLGSAAGLLMPAAAGTLADWAATPRIGLLAPAITAFLAAALLAAAQASLAHRGPADATGSVS
jgi:MFS transporter, DHA1 family, inner membrane transport protein